MEKCSSRGCPLLFKEFPFDLDVMLCLQVEELEEKLSDQTQEVERLRSELVRLHLDVLHPDKMF